MTYTKTRGAPDPREANSPWYEVTEADVQAAEEAVSREDIPRAYQEDVRRYFESIHSTRPAPSRERRTPSAEEE